MKRKTPDAFHSGELVTASGKVVGTHEGHQHFTIGQRKGVGVALGHPIYVVDIDPAANRVIVGEKQDLLRRELVANQINLLSGRLKRGDEIRCEAKIRYNSPPQKAVVTVTGEDQMGVKFDEPQPAITPGQAVVVFDGDVVLGGGWIDRVM